MQITHADLPCDQMLNRTSASKFKAAVSHKASSLSVLGLKWAEMFAPLVKKVQGLYKLPAQQVGEKNDMHRSWQVPCQMNSCVPERNVRACVFA